MSVFRKFWAIYAVLLFLILMAVSLPIIGLNMIFTPGKTALHRNIYYLHHIFTPIFLTFAGIRLNIKGREKLSPTTAYIIVGNHRSSIDFIVNAAAFPGVYRYLAKKELHKIPVFGWVVKKMCLSVDRSSAMSRARSVVDIKNHLAEGWSIFIYPEGSRNTSDAPLRQFYDGAFRIAIQTGAPIAIQTIINIRELSATAKSIDLRPGTVNIVWDEPIETKDLTIDDITTLKERVEKIMTQHLVNAG